MRTLCNLFLAVVLGGCAGSIDLQAHRGGRGLLPENTLPAFAHALKIGVTTLELDAAITRDGVVVISHDPVLNSAITRGPDGKWLTQKGPPIYSQTYADLLQYDIGRIDPASKYAEQFPTQRAIDGLRFATLAELFVLVAASGDTRVRFSIETKLSPFQRDATVAPEDFVDALLSVIDAHGMRDRVSLQSFDWRTLKIAQQKAPTIPTVYLSAQQKFFDNINAGDWQGSAWTAGLNAREFGDSVARMVNAAGGAAWSPYFRDIDQAKVREAQALGLHVIVWTVNETADIERMLNWKVDGIISDYPDRVRTILAARNLRVR